MCVGVVERVQLCMHISIGCVCIAFDDDNGWEGDQIDGVTI